jgi:hypothetical protein
MDWVRLYHDMPTDPKWRVIARKSGQRIGDVIAVWTFVLVNASANGADRGRLNNLSNEDLAAALDLDEQDVKAILDAMEGRVLAEGRLTAWEVRNPKREDDAAQRTRDWRERKRTRRDAPVTHGDSPEKEKDTESEAEAKTRAREADANEMNRLNRLLGFDETNFTAHAANIRTLIDLKADGCDFERHIWPAAEAAAKTRKAIRSLSYIRPKAEELRDAQKTVQSLPTPFEDTDMRGWRDRIRVFREKKIWSPKWGPKPGEPGCKVPAELLTEAA